jgi:phosphohistidine phosphatase
MIIHLVRHAEAVERSKEIPEEHRYLTRRGRKSFRKVASSIKKLGINPDLILTSPLIRAVQTAEILAQRLKHKRDLLVSPLLAPGFGPETLEELLKQYPLAQEIALVGHEPDLGGVAQTLLGVDAACTLEKGAMISFKRAAGEEDGADFIQLVTGGGKIVTSRSKALDRLLNA